MLFHAPFRGVFTAAQDFLTKLQYLASKKILVNDFNPANFLVDRNGHVSFIDCDSFQIPGEGKSIDITKTYFASQVAPELLENPKLLARPRNIHHVEFAAAPTVFNVLMCGLHPYSYFDPSRQSACGTPDENLRKGRCPLGIGAHCKFPLGNWYNLWSCLTFDLKNPSFRPSATDTGTRQKKLPRRTAGQSERTSFHHEDRPGKDGPGSRQSEAVGQIFLGGRTIFHEF